MCFDLFCFSYKSEKESLTLYIMKCGDYIFFFVFAKCEYSAYYVEQENVMLFTQKMLILKQ